MKKKYNITFDSVDEVTIVKPQKELILENIPKGSITSAMLVSKAFGIGRRSALTTLIELEHAGLLKSTKGVVKYKNGGRAKARLFKRI
tara:strand:+ start:59 stop:322 length:264 start_codon:yes stop_codon:yes gene_type:complete